ncbi:hypothetical protein ACFVW5_04900 [Streptomyces sp. NPDC058232]|uniref:hypothetical protein n=1 Tax=Streptomyces sp. NPDC058232 TaxID=3346393 RepID=UPI0036E12BE2
MRVELEWLATEVIAELPTAQARIEVRSLIVDVLRHPELWPAPGGEEAADVFGGRCWVSVVAYLDGIEVRDIGWCG